MSEIHTATHPHLITNSIRYSFWEKYLQIEPEGRISRLQFFLRVLFACLLVLAAFGSIAFTIGIAVIIFSSWFDYGYLFFLGFQPLYLICLISLYRFLRDIVVKRCHDFGSNGDMAKKILFTILIVPSLASPVYSLLSFLLASQSQGLSMVSSGNAGYFVVIMVGALLKYIMPLLILVLILSGVLTFAILLFRKGNPDDNQYGENPRNTKINFFG